MTDENQHRASNALAMSDKIVVLVIVILNGYSSMLRQNSSVAMFLDLSVLMYSLTLEMVWISCFSELFGNPFQNGWIT